jgi:hypothetical protein
MSSNMDFCGTPEGEEGADPVIPTWLLCTLRCCSPVDGIDKVGIEFRRSKWRRCAGWVGE